MQALGRTRSQSARNRRPPAATLPLLERQRANRRIRRVLVPVDKLTRCVLAAAAALCVAALAVRTLPAPRAVDPRDAVEEGPRIAEPMQFLGRGAGLRAAELDTWVAVEKRPRFKALREQVFHIEGCPGAVDWLEGVEGQRVARLIGDLRLGTREEALASLMLVYRLCRATEWKPAILTKTPEANAERLAALFADWLRAWGDRGARDPLLVDPARAAALTYGRLMRTAQQAPVIGTNSAAYERGVRFLGELVGLDAGRRTALGEVLQARHPEAMRRLTGADDRLRGFDDEARTLFPELTGDCPR